MLEAGFTRELCVDCVDALQVALFLAQLQDLRHFGGDWFHSVGVGFGAHVDFAHMFAVQSSVD